MRDAVIEKEELERLLEAEFPETFDPGTGLAILEIWYGGCRVRQSFHTHSLRPGRTISGAAMMLLADGGDACRPVGYRRGLRVR
jgi:hypothetical protein